MTCNGKPRSTARARGLGAAGDRVVIGDGRARRGPLRERRRAARRWASCNPTSARCACAGRPAGCRLPSHRTTYRFSYTTGFSAAGPVAPGWVFTRMKSSTCSRANSSAVMDGGRLHEVGRRELERAREIFLYDEKHKTVSPTELGIDKVERMLKIEHLYDPSNVQLVNDPSQSLKAEALYKRDVDYVVPGGRGQVSVDEFTGRIMEGRRWLGRACTRRSRRKEGVAIQEEHPRRSRRSRSRTTSACTRKLAGMTGTAKTEEKEFVEIYGLDVIPIPTVRERRPQGRERPHLQNEGREVRRGLARTSRRPSRGEPTLATDPIHEAVLGPPAAASARGLGDVSGRVAIRAATRAATTSMAIAPARFERRSTSAAAATSANPAAPPTAPFVAPSPCVPAATRATRTAPDAAHPARGISGRRRARGASRTWRTRRACASGGRRPPGTDAPAATR